MKFQKDIITFPRSIVCHWKAPDGVVYVDTKSDLEGSWIGEDERIGGLGCGT